MVPRRLEAVDQVVASLQDTGDMTEESPVPMIVTIPVVHPLPGTATPHMTLGAETAIVEAEVVEATVMGLVHSRPAQSPGLDQVPEGDMDHLPPLADGIRHPVELAPVQVP